MHKQTRGSVRLHAWMAKNGLNQKKLAEALSASGMKVHQTYVSGLLLGRPCSLPVAVQIKRVTKIPVEDWTVEEQAPAAEFGTDVTASAARSA